MFQYFILCHLWTSPSHQGPQVSSLNRATCSHASCFFLHGSTCYMLPFSFDARCGAKGAEEEWSNFLLWGEWCLRPPKGLPSAPQPQLDRTQAMHAMARKVLSGWAGERQDVAQSSFPLAPGPRCLQVLRGLWVSKRGRPGTWLPG